MRRGTVLAAVALLFAIGFPLHAQQQAPKVQLAGAYSYLRLNLQGPGGYSEGLQTNGGTGSVAFSLTNSFSLVGEVGDYETSTVSSAGGASMTFASYLFGPRYSIRKSDILTPYFQTLIGGVKGSNPFLVSGGTIHTDQNALAWTVGGGLDAAVTPHLAVRVFQAEFFFTKWPDGASDRQRSFRVETGLVFNFGKR
ncbi:MAG TPA: outer membrane beta-barrel protein [Candidatus Dormibacteraeota bacterium]|nr:outer membrane beta-barrel protein [Candidatus Dormibacteraeota bacterium]